MQRGEKDLTQRAQRKNTEGPQRRENVRVIEEEARVLPRSLQFAAGAPNLGEKEKNRPLRSG
jgi:hypothetical protein